MGCRGQINVRRATGIHIHAPRTFYAAQKGYKMSKYFDGRQKYDAVRR